MTQPSSSTIAKNAGSLLAASVLTWTLGLVVSILLPRYLGAAVSGQYYLAYSLWAIASIVAAFGIDTLLIKQIARDPEDTNQLLGTSLVLRTALFALTTVGMALYLRLAGYPAQIVPLVGIFGLSALISQYAASLGAVLRGLEHMEFISIASILGKVAETSALLVVMLRGGSVMVLASTAMLGVLVNLMLLAWFLRRVRPLQMRWDGARAWWMLRFSYPYFLVSIWLVLYMQVDVVVISLLVDDVTVGWYAAASKLFGSLLFVPIAMVTAVFPVLTRMHHEAPGSSRRIVDKSFDYLLLVGVPVGLGIFVVANPLVILLFGQEFAPSGPVLALFGLVLIPTHQNLLLGQYFIAHDRQRFWTWIMAFATLTTILLDIVLIPWCAGRFGNGAIGGALAFLVTESGMMIAGIMHLPRGTLAPGKPWLAARIVMAGLLMSAAAAMTLEYFIAVPIVLGAAVYAACIVAFRVVPAEDWALLKKMQRYMVMRMSGRTAIAINR